MAKTQRALQPDLARRVVGQVFAAHHVGDALRRVVHHHRQLVGPEARRRASAQNRRPRRPRPGTAVRGVCRSRAACRPGRAGPPGAGRQAAQAAALGPAGTRVDGRVVALAGQARRRQDGLDVLARAGAGVGGCRSDQASERGRVQRIAPRLPDHGLVTEQAAARKLPQDHQVGAGHAAGRVHIFDAHDPGAAVGPSVEPARQRSDQRARMQRSGGRGRKAPAVGGQGGPHAPPLCGSLPQDIEGSCSGPGRGAVSPWGGPAAKRSAPTARVRSRPGRAPGRTRRRLRPGGPGTSHRRGRCPVRRRRCASGPAASGSGR